MQPGHEEELRRLTLNHESAIEVGLGLRISPCPGGELDAKTCALVRLGALVAMGAAPASFQWAGAAALGAGASPNELIAALTTIAPIVGFARVVAAAPDLALAMGYDVDAALEALVENEIGGTDD